MTTTLTATDYHYCLLLDYAEATVTVGERHESDNTSNFYQSNGHARSYQLALDIDASLFRAWVAEVIQPFLCRIQAGYSIEWYAGQEMARFTPDAQDAQDEIELLMDKGNIF